MTDPADPFDEELDAALALVEARLREAGIAIIELDGGPDQRPAVLVMNVAKMGVYKRTLPEAVAEFKKLGWGQP